LKALLACRLIPLNKNPGIGPIGVGEILRRILGKAIVCITRDHIKNCWIAPTGGGFEMSSKEGTTQSDSIAMAIMQATIPLLLMVLQITDDLPDKQTKSEAYTQMIFQLMVLF